MQKVLAKDFFLYLGYIVTFYFTLVNFTILTFLLADLSFTQAKDLFFVVKGGQVAFVVSALIVILPIFLTVALFLRKDLKKHPEKQEFWIRKWSLALTVFISIAVVAVDLIVLLYKFFNAEEFGPSFLCKVLAVFVIFSATFAYFVLDLKGYWQRNEKTRELLVVVVSIVVLLALVAMVYSFGSPYKRQQIKKDLERINQMEQIHFSVLPFYSKNKRLPENLNELKTNFYPQSYDLGQFRYTVVSKDKYKICADFSSDFPALPSDNDPLSENWRVKELKRKQKDWKYKKGEFCKEFDVKESDLNGPKAIPVPALD